MNELSNEEFEYLHQVFYDHAYYGDDDIVYGDGQAALTARAVMSKLNEEMYRRDRAAE